MASNNKDMSHKLPSHIKKKVDSLNSNVESIVNEAYGHLETDVSGPISLKYSISAPRDVLTDYERAQSVCFITRYEFLPVFEKVKVTEGNGNYYFGNYQEARFVLNEYRPIIQNKKDSVYFQKIHKFCREKLLNDDQTKDLSITAEHIDRGDITAEYALSLDEQYKAIKHIIRNCEFDYIYNGVLQHSDHKFTKRFWKEYHSGKLNYIFMKHALIVGNIKMLMEWHYRLMNALTFPKIGPL